MTGTDREALRATFDTEAERYDRARPGYPPQVFDDLCELGGIGPASRILEIGCGTGQATLPLAERGCEIVAVELGPALAAVARRKLERFTNVRVVVSAFETLELPAEPFDAVVSATAFHWIDPAVRVMKAADALRVGGALATIETHHVSGGDGGFFLDVQHCYERWDPATPPGLRLPMAADVPYDSAEVDASRRFAPTTFRRYESEHRYTAAQYIDLLLTYSGHLALAPENRAGLLDCIRELIESRYGGAITKRYLTQLRVARRLDDWTREA